MFKYKVLTTCHVGGRRCREGEVVEFNDPIKNKYLEPTDVEKTKINKRPDEAPLSSLSKKTKITTGMAAGLKDEELGDGV